jgi:RHS repeat-associated protein
LGSTTSLTNSSGATVQSYAYDAYGQLTSATPAVENPFRYAGQYTDEKTGFQYLRARYYDPATGQFLSRDPLEDSTLQPYAYADNNPTNATDPTGLFSLESVSNAAAGTLDGLTGGYSTKLAGAYLHFDVDCADFGAGFGSGQMLGMVGGLFTGGTEAALAAKAARRLPWAGHKPYAPSRELPRRPNGRPKPESDYPHTQLGTRKGRYPQAREFDENGRPVRDVDWTDHGRSDVHTNPHQHEYQPDGSRGGPGSVRP